MNAIVVDERNNGNEKEQKQSDNSVILIDDYDCEKNCNEFSIPFCRFLCVAQFNFRALILAK